MLISKNTLSSAYAELCLWPPHAWQCLNKTADHSKQVSEQRGDIWVTSATFSTEHSVTHQIFYCLSHALCLFKDRKKCQVSPITCPWVIFQPLNAPEQIAPAEWLLGLVCSFLWPTLIIMPITMAERQTMMMRVNLSCISCVSPSLSSLPFHSLFPAKHLLSWRPLCCSFLCSFPLTHPK